MCVLSINKPILEKSPSESIYHKFDESLIFISAISGTGISNLSLWDLILFAVVF